MKVGFAHISRPTTRTTAPGIALTHVIQTLVSPRELWTSASLCRLATAWNFVAASLYNAAMLSRPRPAAACPKEQIRPASTWAAACGLLRGLAPAVLFSSMALSPAAHAQAPKPESAAKPDQRSDKQPTPPKAAKLAKAGKKVISVDEEFLVEGRLEKPSAFYVLRRSSTDYDWARLDAVFTPLVLESVQDPLF
jgi:hypothetical protein